MTTTDSRLIVLAPGDTVAVARCNIAKGATLILEGSTAVLAQAVTMGHKIAIRPMEYGANVIKYGAPIGSAIMPIAPGAHVHLHNMKSDYTPTHSLSRAQEEFGS